MAVADSVPGVSGGTIAFIFGFYREFLDSIHHTFVGNKEQRKISLMFLGKLAIGWFIGMGISATVISKLLDSNIYFLSSVFSGLTVSAIPFIVLSEKKNIQGKYKYLILTLIGAVIVIGISLLRKNITSGDSINFSSISLGEIAYVFLAGMVAITAMVLPGISGSTLLLIFGVYVPTITSVKALLHFDFSVIPGLIALGFGIIFGLLISIRVIRSALKNYYNEMIYLILGLMVGSLYAIAMGPTTLKNPLPPLSLGNFKIFGFILGVLILIALESIRKMLEKLNA